MCLSWDKSDGSRMLQKPDDGYLQVNWQHSCSFLVHPGMAAFLDFRGPALNHWWGWDADPCRGFDYSTRNPFHVFIHFCASSTVPHFQTIVPHSLPTLALTGRCSRKTITHWLVRSFGRDLVNLICDCNKRFPSFRCLLGQCKRWNFTCTKTIACPFLLLYQMDTGKSWAEVNWSPIPLLGKTSLLLLGAE